jgi:hypothetical protein
VILGGFKFPDISCQSKTGIAVNRGIINKGGVIEMINQKPAVSLLAERFTICRFSSEDPIPEWSKNNVFLSITKTADELSVVCPESCVPHNAKCENDWRVFKVEGPLDFSLIGILASLSTIMANNGISIFAISTYDTDYILVKNKDIHCAINALIEEGYEVRKL